MSKRPPISREDVYAAIQTLRKDGEKVTARNILRITGGSMSTIQTLMYDIFDEEEIEAMAPEISEKLLKDLKTGIGNAVKKGLEKMAQQREESLTLLDQMDNDMTVAAEAYEAEIDLLKADNRALAADRDKTAILLASAENRIALLEKPFLDWIAGGGFKGSSDPQK